MKNKTNLALTVLESTVVLLITTVILGTVFSLSNITKNFRKFQEGIFLFNQDFNFTLNLSKKGGELNILGNTSTICGSGIFIDNTSTPTSKKYYLAVYAPLSAFTVIDCLELSSTTPSNFNLTKPQIYLSKDGNFTSNASTAIERNLDFADEIQLATNTIINFEKASIVFGNPFGEPIVYYTISSTSYRLDFEDYFNLIFKRGFNETATFTIFKTGKIIYQ